MVNTTVASCAYVAELSLPENLMMFTCVNLDQEPKAPMTILLKTTLLIPKIIQWSRSNVPSKSYLNASQIPDLSISNHTKYSCCHLLTSHAPGMYLSLYNISDCSHAWLRPDIFLVLIT